MNRPSPYLVPSSGAAIAALLALLLLAVTAFASSQGAGGSGNPHDPRGGGGTTPPRGRGRLVPMLGDGTLREPSTDRQETTDDPYVLDAGEWDWDLSLAGSSADPIGPTRQAGEHGSGGIESVSVWSREAGRPRGGVVDAGFTRELVSHVGLTLGGSSGLGGGASDAGCFGRISVQS